VPWEYIGACGETPRSVPYSRRLLIWRINLAASYVGITCGWPPKGCEIGITWHEEDGEFRPLLGLHWNESQLDGPPRRYVVNAMQALAQFSIAVDWSKLWPLEQSSDKEPQSEEAQVAALLREIPAKELAKELAGKFVDACEQQGGRLHGEAYWFPTRTDLELFGGRLCSFDQVRLVKMVHAVAPFDLRDVKDLDPYEVALAILQAFPP
jgi:hypothetical protein